jgi:hypothetical protein
MPRAELRAMSDPAMKNIWPVSTPTLKTAAPSESNPWVSGQAEQ